MPCCGSSLRGRRAERGDGSRQRATVWRRGWERTAAPLSEGSRTDVKHACTPRRCEQALCTFAYRSSHFDTNSLDGFVRRCRAQIRKEQRAKRILQREAEQQKSIILGGQKKVKEFCFDLKLQREKVSGSSCCCHGGHSSRQRPAQWQRPVPIGERDVKDRGEAEGRTKPSGPSLGSTTPVGAANQAGYIASCGEARFEPRLRWVPNRFTTYEIVFEAELNKMEGQGITC